MIHAGTRRIRELTRRYQADYLPTVHWPPLQFPIVHANDTYVVLQARLRWNHAIFVPGVTVA